MQSGRKSRRQRAWLSQPANEATVGGRPAQSGGRRQLPAWLRREYEPPAPPWRSGGKGGGGKQKREVAGAGDPWHFQSGASKLTQDEKIPCCNPRCPGIGGKQSFKYKHAVGRGHHGFHCMACNMPWQRSWEVHFNGRPPPAGGPNGEDSTGTMMKQTTGQEKSPVQKALPMMRWMNPIKSSWGRLWRSRMKLQGKRPSTTIRTMRVLRWGRLCSRPSLRQWQPGKQQRGLCFDILLQILLATWSSQGQEQGRAAGPTVGSLAPEEELGGARAPGARGPNPERAGRSGGAQ